MSDISQSNPIIDSEIKIKKENKSDFDFETQEKKDVFYSKRILRYSILFVFLFVIVYVLVISGVHIWSDVSLQLKIINKIIDNIVVIISAAFYILGINFLYKNK